MESTEDKIVYDALDNPIILGNLYGASRNSNGVSSITLGKASKITEKGVTIEVMSYKRAVYNDRAEKREFTKKKVSFLASALFPVTKIKL